MKLLYPAAPAQVPESVTQPGESFRSNIGKVIGAIVAFVLVYLLIAGLALVLTYYCFLFGVKIIAFAPSIWTLLLGSGIMAMGGMVMFFLIKFLFARSQNNGPQGIELQEADEPELFEFIRRVAEEVGTHFPQKIFLIPEVNASVFHSSNFWSLFFRVRKNLNIGLGLINSLNVSEFKSVLAHEFGHFSQDSMRLGSYVYYVNQAIYNMLYENKGWGSAAESIAGINTVLALFVHAAVWIVRGIQWVLQLMYAFINRQYLSLSREMEFHADAIAASVAGSNNMIQALRQVTLGSQIYSETIQKCSDLLGQNAAPANFYTGQMSVAAHFAHTNRLELQKGMPVATPDFIGRQQQVRVVYKNQWASHPTGAEREANLEQIGLQAEVLTEPAWSLFREPERRQKALTEFLYREVEPSKDRETLDSEAFFARYQADAQKFSLPEVFNGYYNSHQLAEPALDALPQDVAAAPMSRAAFEALFLENLSARMDVLRNDIQTLQSISEGRIDTKTFDFDGQKYPKADAGDIKTRLERELAELQAEQDRRDGETVRLFYAAAAAQGPAQAARLLDAYRNLFALQNLRKAFEEPAREAFATTHLLAANNFEIIRGEITERFTRLRYSQEPALRKVFEDLRQAEWCPPEARKKLEDFLNAEIQYQYNNFAHRSNLEKLLNAIQVAGPTLADESFRRLKTVAELQIGLIPDA